MADPLYGKPGLACGFMQPARLTGAGSWPGPLPGLGAG